MRKTYLFLVASLSLFSLLTLTCKKSGDAKSDKIEDVTYSKNFNNSLSDENIWFEFDFTTDSRLNQDIMVRKEKKESFYAGYLLAVETTEHEIYFKWAKISEEPLQFKLTAYLTPEPKHVSELSGVQSTLTHLIPPEPPPPRPPKL